MEDYLSNQALDGGDIGYLPLGNPSESANRALGLYWKIETDAFAVTAFTDVSKSALWVNDKVVAMNNNNVRVTPASVNDIDQCKASNYVWVLDGNEWTSRIQAPIGDFDIRLDDEGPMVYATIGFDPPFEDYFGSLQESTPEEIAAKIMQRDSKESERQAQAFDDLVHAYEGA